MREVTDPLTYEDCPKADAPRCLLGDEWRIGAQEFAGLQHVTLTLELKEWRQAEEADWISLYGAEKSSESEAESLHLS
jgi:hypothetical protein